MSSFFRFHRRVTAFLFALILVAVATKGLCLMPETLAGGQPDAHACCKKGAEILIAGCCMDGQAGPNTSTTAVRIHAPAPVTASISPLGVAQFPAMLRTALITDRLHSPSPPPILRV